MQTYNTNLPKITMPEYGRNIENLIKYCKTIPDRDRRTRYAYGIIEFMARVKNDDNPTESMLQVYWDHLALLSNFELDIDYPYEIIKKSNLNEKPELLSNQLSKIKYRQYGLFVEKMIEKAKNIEDSEKRVRLLGICANHMKLQFHLANKNADEDDEKIIHDLVNYVGRQYAEDCNKINLYSLNVLKENSLYDAASIETTPAKKKKRKKKKK